MVWLEVMLVKIVVADEYPVILDGLRAVSGQFGIQVVGTVTSSDRLLDAIKKHRPAVLVTEVRLDGSDVIRKLETHSASETGCRIVFFSGSDNPVNFARADTIDCFDYILKSEPTVKLWQAVNAAAEGKSTPKNSLLKTTRKRVRETSHWDAAEVPLTHREIQVLQHVAMGLSNREIGRSLGISVETVKEHVQNTLRKLDANDRTQAAVWAVREGLI